MYTHILVPVEDMLQSGEVLEYAAAVASRFNAGLSLLHVVHPTHPMSTPMFFGTGIPADTGEEDALEVVHETEKENVAGARRSLAAKVRELKERGIEASARVVIGQAAESILHVSASEGIDLVVLGSSRRGALKRILSGDVVDEVIRNSKVPVLIIPDTSDEAD